MPPVSLQTAGSNLVRMRKRSSPGYARPGAPAAPPYGSGWPIALGAVTLAAAVCKLVLAVRTYGSNDVYAFERFSGWSSYLGAELTGRHGISIIRHPCSMSSGFWNGGLRYRTLVSVLAGASRRFWQMRAAFRILFQILKSRLHEAYPLRPVDVCGCAAGSFSSRVFMETPIR